MNRFYDWKTNAVDPQMSNIIATFDKQHMDKLAEVFDLYDQKQYSTVWGIMTSPDNNAPFDLLDSSVYNMLLEAQMTLASIKNYKSDILELVSPIDALKMYDEFIEMLGQVNRYLDIIHRLTIVNDHVDYEFNY